MDRPNKAEHEKNLKALTNEIDALKAQRQKVQTSIDLKMNDPNDKNNETRQQFNQLRTQKNKMLDEKKALRAKLDATKAEADKLVQDKKSAKGNIRFHSVEDIDKEIHKLQKIQETTTMSLQEEKKLIKELDQLEASKKTIADLKSKDVGIDNVKEQRKVIQQQLNMKDKEIDAVQKEMDDLKVQLDEAKKKDDKKRESIKSLFEERDQLKQQIGEKLKVKDSMRDEFREMNNKWYQYNRAVKAQRQLQYEEEKKKREEEEAAYRAKLEEEEMKKIPYEAEQALCDFLANYLERTYLGKDDSAGKTNGKKDDAVVPVKDDPFAGLKPKAKNDDEVFFEGGKAPKKKRDRSKKQETAAPFTLSVDIFEQFSLIQMNPPTSVDQVSDSVKALQEKKEWYKQQPRGSVPTAADIRKAAEKEVQKLKQPKQESKPSKKGTFDLASDDFAPLSSSAATGGVNSSWGKSS